MNQGFFRLAARVERWAARAQGKGFGATSIRREVSLAASLLGAAPQLIVDIGGNVGNYTAELRSRFPAAEVHVFEPSQTNVNRLRDRFAGDRLVHVVPRAVSDQSGDVPLYSNAEGSGLASLSKRRLDHFGIPFDRREPVQAVRFEDYWKDVLRSRPVDLVKMDIEGHEMAALLGCGEAIGHIRVIQFEFGGCNIDSRTFFQDFWYFFEAGASRFRLNRVTPWGLQEIPRYSEGEEYFVATNYLAVSREWPTSS